MIYPEALFQMVQICSSLLENWGNWMARAPQQVSFHPGVSWLTQCTPVPLDLHFLCIGVVVMGSRDNKIQLFPEKIIINPKWHQESKDG